MEYFMTNIIVPLIVVAILIMIINTVVKIVVDIFHVGIYFVRLICFFIVYYFVGEYVLSLVENYIATDIPDIIRFIYMPIQVVLNYLNINI